MAGTFEYDVASQVGCVVFQVGNGNREQHVHGIQAADHEVGRLRDLGLLQMAGEPDAAVDAAIPVDRTAEPVAVILDVSVEVFLGEPAGSGSGSTKPSSIFELAGLGRMNPNAGASPLTA